MSRLVNTVHEDERTLAPAHECPWCRSLAVVVAMEAGDDRILAGRCTDCDRHVALVPLGFAC